MRQWRTNIFQSASELGPDKVEREVLPSLLNTNAGIFHSSLQARLFCPEQNLSECEPIPSQNPYFEDN